MKIQGKIIKTIIKDSMATKEITSTEMITIEILKIGSKMIIMRIKTTEDNLVRWTEISRTRMEQRINLLFILKKDRQL
jgi:hypothetical protein